MEQSPLYRLTTPGGYPAGVVLSTSMVVMIVLGVYNFLSVGAVRVDVLYLFPLAAVGLHCERNLHAILGLILAFGLTLIPPMLHQSPTVSVPADLGMFLLSAVVVVLLSRAARQNYLDNATLAKSDALTGLHNRRSFEATLEIELARQKRYGGVFSVVLVELGNFKQLNETMGYQAGDKALKMLSEVLKEHTRTTDSIARIGSNEFAVLMPYARNQDCNTICNLLSALIATRMSNEAFAISSNIGFSTFDAVPESTTAVLLQAERALDAAKRDEGKNSVVSV